MPTRRANLVKQLDDIVSLVVRARDKKCVVCWKTENLTAGHYISRRKRATRWDLRNVNTQCWGCNKAHRYWPHRYERYMLDCYGVETVKQLGAIADQPIFKWKLDELEQMKIQLARYLELIALADLGLLPHVKAKLCSKVGHSLTEGQCSWCGFPSHYDKYNKRSK